MPAPMTLPGTALLSVLALVLTGCDAENQSAANAPDARVAKQVEPAAPKGAEPQTKVKVVDGKAPALDDRYAVYIDTPQAVTGQEGKVTVRIVPKEPWHMNLDFPTSLEVEPPAGITLAKAELNKADATKLDASSCQFDLAFTPTQSGDQAFTGKVDFAVCKDEACSRVTEDVAFKVAVK